MMGITALLFSVTSNQTNYSFPVTTPLPLLTIKCGVTIIYYNIIIILFFSSTEWMSSVAVFDINSSVKRTTRRSFVSHTHTHTHTGATHTHTHTHSHTRARAKKDTEGESLS